MHLYYERTVYKWATFYKVCDWFSKKALKAFYKNKSILSD